ncbi:cytochrome c oxidase assembly protein COX16 homolog, mitochondrial [Frieseomelitta varia]|uniref:cytochrome c oxidase assembly protein COX16 homolog, mitochondrial n=1 Tax=Frieseomelitta varia TaxID=561572 RepID=UPI001CB67C5E|nr:cytochrome c oxidase assembly protein COX16 homolog, mitochondrial [Frieseomelitta varia]
MKKFFKGRFVQQFLPFIILITGGSFVIREFVGLKYKYPKVTSHDLDVEIKKKGIEMKKPRTLEEEYEIIKTLDIDNWENIRISRPWDESNVNN